MKKHSTQQGSAHAIVTICLVLVLVTALGWIFYQNFIAKEPVQKDTELVVVDKSNDDTVKKDPESEDQEKDVNKGYLVLNDWKVRLKIPEDLKETKLIYWTEASENGQGEVYYFNTVRVRDLDEGCDKNSQFATGKYSLASMLRSESSQSGGIDTTTLNGNKPIKGYYYSTPGGGATCYSGMQKDNLDKDEILNKDAAAVKKMLTTVQAL